MPGFQNIGLKDYLKRYGYKYGLKRGIFLTNPIHIIKDYEYKKVLYYSKTKAYIERKYGKYADVRPDGIQYGKEQVDNPTWVYWKQGIENAPDIVRTCYQALIKNEADKVILLSDSNIEDYIKLPERIIDRNREGKISNAAMSDLIRLSLLEHYGGTWVDATVLLTGKLPSYITKSDFFAYKDTVGFIHSDALITSWLMHAKKHNPLIQYAENLIYAYWENEDEVCEYLLIYILLTMAEEKCKGSVGWYPFASSEPTRMMFNLLGNKFNERDLKHCLEMSTVHKLTYKISEDTVNDLDSFYNGILRKFGSNGDK